METPPCHEPVIAQSISPANLLPGLGWKGLLNPTGSCGISPCVLCGCIVAPARYPMSGNWRNNTFNRWTAQPGFQRGSVALLLQLLDSGIQELQNLARSCGSIP